MKKEKELARLFRPVDASFFPQSGMIAMLDRENNIVFYDRDVFERLDNFERRKIFQLDQPYLELVTPSELWA